jgi:ATP-dependent DNA ligase
VVDALAERLPAGTVVDGELVVMSEHRLDFSALQRRLTSRRVQPDAPATLVVFDLLAHAGVDLRPLRYQQRRARLEQLVTDSCTGLALVPATPELAGARAWMRHGHAGVEGVVAKRGDHGYYPRRHHW